MKLTSLTDNQIDEIRQDIQKGIDKAVRKQIRKRKIKIQRRLDQS